MKEVTKGTEVLITNRACRERGITPGFRYLVDEVLTDVLFFPYKIKGIHLSKHGFACFDANELIIVNKLQL